MCPLMFLIIVAIILIAAFFIFVRDYFTNQNQDFSLKIEEKMKLR